MMFALVIAPLLAAAEPAEVPAPTVLPKGMADKGRSGGAAVELLIDPDGKVVECRELAHFGDTRLAAKACEVEWAGTWDAAKDANGRAAYALVRTARLMGPDRPAIVPEPDLEMEVEALPGAARARAVDVLVEVDARGQATACQPAPEADAGLAAAACSLPAAKLATRPVKVPGGEATTYVTTRTVRFVTKAD